MREQTDGLSEHSYLPAYFVSNGNVGVDLSKNAMLMEDAMTSYSGGVAFSYQINNRFSIQSGLSYSSVGHSIGGISVFSGFFRHAGTKSGPLFDVSTSNGTIVDFKQGHLSYRLLPVSVLLPALPLKLSILIRPIWNTLAMIFSRVLSTWSFQ